MNHFSRTQMGRACITGFLVPLLTGCGTLLPAVTSPPSYFSLDNARLNSQSAHVPGATLPRKPLTLIVNPPHAAPGFSSQRIVYVREPHKLEYFAHSEWVDTPARMLAPLVVAAMERSGTFSAVVLTPSAAVGELRLDTEIVRLQQDFGTKPSGVRFTLRAYIVDNVTHKVLAWRELDETAFAESEDPYGGVIAANRVTRIVLERLGAFCAEAAAQWNASAVVP